MPDFDAIIIGAGVVGPCLATALARQGRKVMLIEREWTQPDRIVGELMQPAGLKALQELGMIQAVNNIGAIHVEGYYIKYYDEKIQIKYIEKEKAETTNPVRSVPDCVFDGNDKMDRSDKSLLLDAFEDSKNVRGVAFHHGRFLMNLRSIARAEPNVTCLEGTATAIIRDEDDLDTVRGVKVKLPDGTFKTYTAKLTFACDGIYSKFRKEHAGNSLPHTGLYFVGLALKNALLPAPHNGHVILGKHAPVLLYQISDDETRMLCAYRLSKPPAHQDFHDYLMEEVLPSLPEETRPSFAEAVQTKKWRAMPNQFLSAPKQGNHNKGFIMLGDSLNMRHPLTGGGMTVGLNDTALLARLLHPKQVDDFENTDDVSLALKQFNTKRKNLDSVINTLSIALYSLFAADNRGLMILQEGCYKYFLLGGDYVSGPIGLLSGMLPFPMLLFNHFFLVALYAIYLNFGKRGLSGFPLALYEAFDALFTAVIVFTPYLWKELV